MVISGLIQARMGSERLPGKMLKKISDISLIEWVIERVKKSKKIKKIILATTTNKKDDIFKKIAKKKKISIFRGATNNVLLRFFKAAKLYKSNYIVRICGDNPFIDSGQIDLLIKTFLSRKCDYAFNHQNKLDSKYADGFGAEIFTNDVLQRLYKKAKSKPHREHVTKYIWDNVDEFKILSIPAPKNLAYPNLKFDINTKNDLITIDKLAKINNISFSSKAKEIIKIKLKTLKSKENI